MTHSPFSKTLFFLLYKRKKWNFELINFIVFVREMNWNSFFQVLPKNQQLTPDLYRSIFGSENSPDKEARVREFLQTTFPWDVITSKLMS